MKKITLFSISLLFVVATYAQSLPTQIMVLKDTYIDSNAPDVAKGLDGTIWVSNDGTQARETYLRFDISNFLSTDSTKIESVKLSMKANYASTNSSQSQVILLRDVNFMDVDLNILTANGLTAAGLNAVPYYLDNATVTNFTSFFTEKALGSQLARFSGVILAKQIITLDISKYIKWAITNGKQIVTLHLAREINFIGLTSNRRTEFYSLESTAVDNRAPALDIVYKLGTNISTVQTDKLWSIFPTIASKGSINISTTTKLNTPAQIKIYNMTGGVVNSFNCTSSYSLNVNDFIAGSYILSIATQDGVENHRFVVVN